MKQNILDFSKYNFIKLLSDVSEVQKILLFGSRARGDNRERSDIDIAIVRRDNSDLTWNKILEIVEDADTLLKIDCLDLNSLEEGSLLKKQIFAEGRVLYERKQ